MLWCFVSAAALMTLLAMVAATAHPLRWLAQLRPGALLRGCLALACLSMAAGLALAAALLSR